MDLLRVGADVAGDVPTLSVPATLGGMTDPDKAAARRDITDALLSALNRRHEVLDVIVDAEDRNAAIDNVANLLGTSRTAAEAVIGLSFAQITKESRRQIAAELDDLNSQLSFTLQERPASAGDTLELRPFSATDDRDIFAARTSDVGARETDPARPRPTSTRRFARRCVASTPKRRPGSSRSRAARRSGWCSVNSSAAR